MKIIFYITMALTLFACETAPFSGQEAYEKKIEAFSAGDKQFSGLYHNFEFRATLLNQEIIQLMNERMAKMYGWNEAKAAEELQKKMEKAQKSTRFFLSFYTPQIVDDNLTTSKSIWKIYLHSGSQRFEGEISKSNENLSEFQALYPYHNRFATGYYVDFPVATETVQNETLRFEITGPLGQRAATYPAQKSL